ncbi:hypothetical protein OMP95_09260 [Methylophaga sp. OBS4]|nr:hypothetical protein [Methylophaga sp. OBS4]
MLFQDDIVGFNVHGYDAAIAEDYGHSQRAVPCPELTDQLNEH